MALTILSPASEEPREIVDAALFAASDESSYVNGAKFLVDGGVTAAYVTPQ
jgi:NAD(P)-dependent dehydrogenase (short-subunit alcohol dehydrogenase family)